MRPLPERVLDALEKAELTTQGTRLLLAVSGGADSVALFTALVTLQAQRAFTFVVAHLNHGIRDDAQDDAAFVEAICRQAEIPCFTDAVNVPASAQKSHQSIEMQAREMRYAFFKRIAHQNGCHAVLTAHTLDDQAETILMNLCRGGGPEALAGIRTDRVRNGIRLVRPLLHTTRNDVEAYLKQMRQDWREDATNQDITYRRNAVRREVLPLLRKRLNPSIHQALAKTAEIIASENEWLESLATEHLAAIHPNKDETSLSLPPFRKLPLALRRRLLLRWLQRCPQAPQPSFDTVDRLDQLAKQTSGGKCVQLSSSLTVCHEYDKLKMRSLATGQVPQTTDMISIQVPGTTILPTFGMCIQVQISTGFTHNPAGTPGQLPAEAYIRRDSISPPHIRIRKRQAGDRVALLGMQGTRKLQDILTDSKLPAKARDHIPVLLIDDEIVWVPGCRPSRHWAVSSKEAPSLHLRVWATTAES